MTDAEIETVAGFVSIGLGLLVVIPSLWITILEFRDRRKNPTGEHPAKLLWRPYIFVGFAAALLFWGALELSGTPANFWSFMFGGMVFGILADRFMWLFEYRSRRKAEQNS